VFAIVIVADPLVDVASPTSGRASVVAAREILLERRALLQQLLSLFLELSLELLKLLQLELWLPHGGYHSPSRWWHGNSPDEIRAARWSSGRGMLALVVEQIILLLLFLFQLDIAHEALAGGVMVPIVEVGGLEEVVAVAEETSQSPRVVEPGEIGGVPATVVFAGVSVRGHLKTLEELRDGLHVVVR
jgi:hypothetical protein